MFSSVSQLTNLSLQTGLRSTRIWLGCTTYIFQTEDDDFGNQIRINKININCCNQKSTYSTIVFHLRFYFGTENQDLFDSCFATAIPLMGHMVKTWYYKNTIYLYTFSYPFSLSRADLDCKSSWTTLPLFPVSIGSPGGSGGESRHGKYWSYVTDATLNYSEGEQNKININWKTSFPKL